MAYVVVIITS